jgi:PAS domain S-box-containing protein
MEARKLTGVRVLVADDDPSTSRMLAEVLRTEGYQPIICTHPREVLAVYEQEAFGLAFLDLNLPEMSGLELASTLKHQDPLCEVVFITGHHTFDNALQGNKIGVNEYLRKPFNITELKLCLKRFQERQVLRKKVRLTEQRYFHLVQNLPLVIFVVRRDFHLEFVNQASAAILGYTPEEAMYIPNWFLERIHFEDRERIRESFDLAFKSGGYPFSIQCRLIHKNGHLVDAIVRSITCSTGEVRHPVDRLEGIILDITDRISLEKALIQKEKLNTLGTIAAEVAHEIRNPLVSIGGFARRLKKRFPGSSECDIILSETRRLEKVLGRVRNYLKPREIRHQECSVNTLIGDCLDLLSPVIERRGVMCRLDLDPRLSAAHVDPDVLIQIFINLIHNAAAAMNNGGQLIIKTYERDQGLHIDFKNPILGPLVKDPELLFLPLGEGGKSIGLPLCYRLLKRMGGTLSFTQERNNAVFSITLPKSTGVSSEIERIAEQSDTFQNAITMPEKRQYPRAEVGWACTLRAAVKSIEGTVRNISVDGAFISCKYPLALNETFQTLIEATSRKSFSVMNEVVWSNFDCLRTNKNSPRGIGVRFMQIFDEDRQFLHEIIAGQCINQI